jgi:hypothetical protein
MLQKKEKIPIISFFFRNFLENLYQLCVNKLTFFNSVITVNIGFWHVIFDIKGYGFIQNHGKLYKFTPIQPSPKRGKACPSLFGEGLGWGIKR